MVPAGSPKIVPVGSEVLEVHLGDVPGWLKRAEARVRIVGEAMLMALFQNAPMGPEQLNERLSQAKEHALVDEKHKWLVAVVLRWQVDLSDTEVSDQPWLWLDSGSYMETEKAARARIASLDLAARVLKFFLPNVFDEVAVSDRIYLARDDSFGDAFSMPQSTARADLSSTTTMEQLATILAGTELDLALANAMTAPAVPKDSTRPDRLRAALHSDLLADDGGSYGRYELLREMQPVLMRASSGRPLSVMFVDMNGLKQINDTQGHHAGDEAIAEFRKAVREVHHEGLFRTGGDEFVLFSLGAPGEAPQLARRILLAVATRRAGGTPLSASVGVVLATNPRETPDAIVERADREMYRAKEESRKQTPRPCVLAVEGAGLEVVSPLAGQAS